MDDEPLMSRVEDLERRATRDFLEGDDYAPTPDDLGFTDAELAKWNVPLEAAEAHIEGILAGRGFNEVTRGPRPRVESKPFALELTNRIWEWRRRVR